MASVGSASASAISVRGLRKVFSVKSRGASGAPSLVEAVASIDLDVPAGVIFAFLGPNGAGKTTTLRILTTLLPATSGTARVAGYDVATQQADVRRHIGYVGQLGGTDLDHATGRENVMLAGRLYGLRKQEAVQRAEELLHAFDLETFADRETSTYSGGQRRRLDVALGMVGRPQVLFLDEPTTGLDPQNRRNLWDRVRALRDEGTTVFLTTHYLDEADELADDVAIMDHGAIIARGTPEALKAQTSASTLDEVFLTLTGHALRDGAQTQEIPA